MFKYLWTIGVLCLLALAHHVKERVHLDGRPCLSLLHHRSNIHSGPRGAPLRQVKRGAERSVDATLKRGCPPLGSIGANGLEGQI
jgi:hypothetical protein